MDVSKLEPADRNLKRELTTLLVILFIAFAAGGLILYKYVNMSSRQNKEVSEGRSPEIGELVKNYSFKDKNDKEKSFFDFTGQVTLVACFSVDQLDDSKLILDTLKEYEAEFQQEKRVGFLLLSMDEESAVSSEKLQKVLAENGMSGEKWKVARANGDPFLAYIKKQLKFIHLAKNKRDGKWIISQRIRVIDPDLKIRGKESEYDFRKILLDQQEARKSLANNDKFKNHPDYKGDITKIDLVGHATGVIKKSIYWMLENENFDKEAIDTEKKSNIYTPYLWLFGGFILFIIILGLKVRKK